MKTLIFLRHGHSAANATHTLTGRLPGVGLSDKGKAQARGLIARLGSDLIESVHISPIERCQYTIDPWLRSEKSNSIKSFEIVDGLSEIDFGVWSGRKLSSLRRNPLWKDIQNHPSRVTFPGGESFRTAQRRGREAVDQILETRGSQRHLVVSHSDTIKLMITSLLGSKLDSFQSLTVDPASFSIVTFSKSHFQLVTINNSSALREILG